MLLAFFTTKTIQIMLWQDMVLLSAHWKFAVQISLSLSHFLAHTRHTQMVKYALTHISCSKPQTCLMCFWLDCWGFYCICFGIGNYTSSSRHSSLVCWKDIWADRTRIALGCFWSGCYYGSKSSWGDDIFWLMFDLCASQVLGFLLDDGFFSVSEMAFEWFSCR